MILWSGINPAPNSLLDFPRSYISDPYPENYDKNRHSAYATAISVCIGVLGYNFQTKTIGPPKIHPHTLHEVKIKQKGEVTDRRFWTADPAHKHAAHSTTMQSLRGRATHLQLSLLCRIHSLWCKWSCHPHRPCRDPWPSWSPSGHHIQMPEQRGESVSSEKTSQQKQHCLSSWNCLFLLEFGLRKTAKKNTCLYLDLPLDSSVQSQGLGGLSWEHNSQ